MPYFKEDNILLIHIPKTGGTSVETYFYNKFNIKRNTNNLFSGYGGPKLNKKFDHSLQHLTYEEILSLNIIDRNPKILTIVRNPYERLVSDLFNYKLINFSKTKEQIYQVIEKYIKSDDIYDNHKIPQYKFIVNSNNNIIDCIIMKTESLTEDMKNNGYEDFDIKANTNRSSNGDNVNYLNLLSDKAIDLINDYYRYDFEYFGYRKIITKKLFLYWHSGFKNAPTLIKRCLLSWKLNNPNWSIIELDDSNLNQYIELPDLSNKTITKTSLSDIIRITLLNKYNGIWCDATTYCMKPLDKWIYDYVNIGFFAFDKPGGDKLLSSWFLYGEKHNYIINKMYEYVINFWNNNDSTDEYFWFHILFKDLYDNDILFKNEWDKVRKISANNSHYLLTNNVNKYKEHIANNSIPVYKLTYKYGNFDYLIKPHIKLIHVGKTGGTFIKERYEFNDIHLKVPIFNQYTYYIITIRNPLTRFVSAFNMMYYILNEKIEISPNKLTLDNCLAPGRMKMRMNGDKFPERYEYLVNFFENANYLAESISSDDEELRNKAIELLNFDNEHIYKGLSYYLNNGEFIRNYHKNILMVIRMEHNKEDCMKLNNLLSIEMNNFNKIRENKTNKSKYLSELAIKNLIEFYKDTEYKVLRDLLEYNFIDNETYQNYFIY